jgi:hypothetical protein
LILFDINDLDCGRPVEGFLPYVRHDTIVALHSRPPDRRCIDG